MAMRGNVNRPMRRRLPLLLGLATALCISVVVAPELGQASETTQQRLLGTASGDPLQVPDNYTRALPVFDNDPTHWGGAYADGDVLVMKVVGQSLDEAQAALQKAGVTDGVRLLGSEQSIALLSKTQEAAEQVLKSTDMKNVNTWGPKYRDSSIVVGVSDADGTLQEKLAAAELPGGPKIVVEVVPGQPSPSSRYYDTVPYYGGNAIALFDDATAPYRQCSTAFQMVGSDGYSYAATAGHCYRYPDGLGDTTKVWRWDTSNSRHLIGTTWTTSVTLTGNASGRKGDLSFYRLNPVSGRANNALGSDRLFVGNGDTTATRTVAGSTVLPEDYHTSALRTSGASGKYQNNSAYGEISPDWISLVNQSVHYTNGPTYAGMSIAEDASECVRGGDSGGAVYLQSGSSSATAVGVISGTNNQGAGPTNCRNYYSPINTFYVSYAIR